jgi:serine/threonine-protein kinase
MLTGCGMYPANSPIEWLTAHARQPAPHLVEGNPALGGLGELDALLQRCFAKRPEGRPADAEALIREIEQVERGLGLATAEPAAAATLIPDPPTAPGRKRFSPSSYFEALPPPGLAEVPRSSAPTIDAAPVTSETGAVVAPPSRRGLWLVLGAVAIAGVVIVAIVVAASGKSRRVPITTRTMDAAAAPSADAAVVAIATPPVDAGVDGATHVAVAVAHPNTGSGSASTGSASSRPARNSELEQHLANAVAAQQAGKRMTQVTQAHAAYLLDPKNVRAVLLLADGLLAEGDLEHGCKYLRELGRNPVAVQRIKSASCPIN